MIKDEDVKCFYLDGETYAKLMKTHCEGTPNYDMPANPNKRKRTC